MENHKRSFTYHSFLQSLFLTANFYKKNDLIMHASACTFGFLFSVFPVIILTLVIVLRFLHISPDAVIDFFNFESVFTNIVQIKNIINSTLQVKGTPIFEITISISIFWMARRFFVSIMTSTNRIFHTAIVNKPLIHNLIILLFEVVFIVAIAISIASFITFRSISNNFHFQQFFPKLTQILSAQFIFFLPYILLFICTFLFYRFAPRTKPNFFICVITASLCTASFFLVHMVFSLFLNISQYNLVYGFLSNIIVLLFEIFLFFMLFLFFLQTLFVLQNFESLVIAQLYLLPKRNDMDTISVIKRSLFLESDYKLLKNTSIVEYEKNSVIVKENEIIKDVYYIIEGSVKLSKQNKLAYAEKGSFFGDFACITNNRSDITAQTMTYTKVMKISFDQFTNLIEKNPEIVKKAFSTVSSKITQLNLR